MTSSGDTRIAGNAVSTDMQAAVSYYLMCNISLKSSKPSTAASSSSVAPSREALWCHRGEHKARENTKPWCPGRQAIVLFRIYFPRSKPSRPGQRASGLPTHFAWLARNLFRWRIGQHQLCGRTTQRYMMSKYHTAMTSTRSEQVLWIMLGELRACVRRNVHKRFGRQLKGRGVQISRGPIIHKSRQ